RAAAGLGGPITVPCPLWVRSGHMRRKSRLGGAAGFRGIWEIVLPKRPPALGPSARVSLSGAMSALGHKFAASIIRRLAHSESDGCARRKGDGAASRARCTVGTPRREGPPARGIRVARLHAEVQVDDRAAGVVGRSPASGASTPERRRRADLRPDTTA